jgi:SPP1 family predicted phage head-tail adaptor
MLTAGTFNRQVRIQRKTAGEDSLGEASQAWEDVAVVWANIRHLNGKEYLSGAQEISKAVASIRIRYRDDITAAMRVIYRGAVYNIEAVLPDMQRREYVDLAASSGANDG